MRAEARGVWRSEQHTEVEERPVNRVEEGAAEPLLLPRPLA